MTSAYNSTYYIFLSFSLAVTVLLLVSMVWQRIHSDDDDLDSFLLLTNSPNRSYLGL